MAPVAHHVVLQAVEVGHVVAELARVVRDGGGFGVEEVEGDRGLARIVDLQGPDRAAALRKHEVDEVSAQLRPQIRRLQDVRVLDIALIDLEVGGGKPEALVRLPDVDPELRLDDVPEEADGWVERLRSWLRRPALWPASPRCRPGHNQKSCSATCPAAPRSG